MKKKKNSTDSPNGRRWRDFLILNSAYQKDITKMRLSLRTTIQPISITVFFMIILYFTTFTRRIKTQLVISKPNTTPKYYPPVQSYEDKVMFNAVMQRITDKISVAGSVRMIELNEHKERLINNWVYVEDPKAFAYEKEKIQVITKKGRKKEKKKEAERKKAKEANGTYTEPVYSENGTSII
jgi:hypothetical protein